MIFIEHGTSASASASQRSCFNETPHATIGHEVAEAGLRGFRKAIDFAEIDVVSVVSAR